MSELENKLKLIFETNLVEDLLKSSPLLEVKEGDILIDYGKRVTSLPFIVKGTIRVMKRDEEGREILLYYLSSNESCAMAYSCCMEAKYSEVKAVAEDDVQLLQIPHQKLEEWLIGYKSWRSYVFNSFSHRFNELLKSLESIAFHKLDERLIKYLKNKATLAGRSSILLSHQQIADELGTSRVVISRLLKQLENDGKLILYRNEIKLLKAFGLNN